MQMKALLFCILAISSYIIRHHYHYLKRRDIISDQQKNIFLGFKQAFNLWIATMLFIALALMAVKPALIVFIVISYLLLVNVIPHLLIKINKSDSMPPT